MKIRVEIKHPQGYPFLLYKVNNKKARKFVASATDVRAKAVSGLKQAKVSPVQVTDLIKEFGHKKTSKILASINPRWMTKDGKIFYKNI